MRRIITFLFSLCLSVLIATPVLAAVDYGNVLTDVGANAGLADETGATTDLLTIIGSIINVALGLLGAVLLVMTIFAGFLWMTAGGNEEQVTKAKAWIKNAVIGLIITLAAYSIAGFVVGEIGKATSSSSSSATEEGAASDPDPCDLFPDNC